MDRCLCHDCCYRRDVPLAVGLAAGLDDRRRFVRLLRHLAGDDDRVVVDDQSARRSLHEMARLTQHKCAWNEVVVPMIPSIDLVARALVPWAHLVECLQVMTQFAEQVPNANKALFDAGAHAPAVAQAPKRRVTVYGP